jgi:hypothetical protein
MQRCCGCVARPVQRSPSTVPIVLTSPSTLPTWLTILPPVSIRHQSFGRPAARNDDGFAERSPIVLLADRIDRP